MVYFGALPILDGDGGGMVGANPTTEDKRYLLYLLGLVWWDLFLGRIDNYVKGVKEKTTL